MHHNKNASGVERRQYERFLFRQKVKVHFIGYESFEFPALDISAGGVGVRSHLNFPSGVICHIEITIPLDNGLLSFKESAELKHTIFKNDEDGFVLGLSYTEIDPSLQAAIVCLMRGKADKKDVVLDNVARLGRHSTL